MLPDPPRNGEVASRSDDGRGSPLGSSPADSPLHPSPFRGGIAFAFLVILLDQFSKWWVTGPLGLPMRESIELLPIFRLVYVENHGVSMGFLTASSHGQSLLLVALTVGIAIVVAVWMWRERKLVEALALGAILGGAIGNIADRGRHGYVTDFLNLHFGAWSPFFVFNVADVAISLGVVLLVIRSLVPSRDTPALGE